MYRKIVPWRSLATFRSYSTSNINNSDSAGQKYKNTPVYSFVPNKTVQNKVKDRLYVWGYSGIGALGEPNFLNPPTNNNVVIRQRKPWRLRWVDRTDADLTNVACGNGFSLIAISGSKEHKGHHLFGCGMNTHSQIGVHPINTSQSYQYIIEPVKIDLPLKITSDFRILDISCGRAHSVVLTNAGIVSFGHNAYGQCGREIIENEQYEGNASILRSIGHYFDELDSDDKVVSVKAGQDHTCFLTSKGQVFTNGWAADGQLGQGIFTLQWKPTRVRGEIEGVKIAQLATKGDFVLALSDDGEIFGWGNNEYKQLEMSGISEAQIGEPRHLKLPSFIPRPIKSIAASGTHCLLIDGENQVWTWGFGLLGKGPKCDESSEPTKIPDTLFGRFNEIDHSLERWPVSVHCGLNNSAVVLNDGSLYMWGKNKYGNLGMGDLNDVFFPLRVNIPATVKKMDLGADQTFAICHTFL